VLESSHVPLTDWLVAAYLMVSSKKGVSSHQLMRTLDCQYKTAWFVTHRLREAMREPHAVDPKSGSWTNGQPSICVDLQPLVEAQAGLRRSGG
jgi:hypothetical protein